MYDIALNLYSLGVFLASFFDQKIRKMRRGEKEAFRILKDKVDKNARYAWFHAASLGEFEQGRPIMERFKAEHPEYKILLTFFSPSGYEVRHNYPGADIICYLPLDTRRNAKRFLSLISVEMAFFIKYEFWQNYLTLLQKQGVPVYSVSSIFRKEQIFFRPYGKGYAKVLNSFKRFFVQNKTSQELLSTLGIRDNVEITGDTRFDRVLSIKNQAKELPIVESFTGGKRTFVAGSSWQPDEDIFIPWFQEHKDWKLIIAPHVIGEDHLKQILLKLKGKAVRYTKTTAEEAKDADCLIIDCFGLLSSIYRYGEIAYVGGGFGVGIHNVLEAAVWGVPVIFGPNNRRFQEARELLTSKGGIEITSYDEFQVAMQELIELPNALKSRSKAAGDYVANRAGATDKIMAAVFGK